MYRDTAIVPLSVVVDGLEMLMDEFNYFLDLKHMSIEYYRPDSDLEEEVELADKIEEEFGDRSLRLPSQYDLDEYSVMEEFIEALPAGKAQNQLDRVINGRGAFRRFKDTLYNFGLEDDWYAFLDNAHKQAAIDWLEGNGLKYVDDTKKTKK